MLMSKCFHDNNSDNFSPQDNSRKEWTFQKAVTIQTYSNYHPIPVPFNILSTLAICVWGLRKKRKGDNADIRREQRDSVSYKQGNGVLC